MQSEVYAVADIWQGSAHLVIHHLVLLVVVDMLQRSLGLEEVEHLHRNLVRHLLAVYLIAEGEVGSEHRLEMLCKRPRLVVNHVRVAVLIVGNGSLLVDRRIAQSALIRQLHAYIEQVLLPLAHHPLLAGKGLQGVCSIEARVVPMAVMSRYSLS